MGSDEKYNQDIKTSFKKSERFNSLNHNAYS